MWCPNVDLRFLLCSIHTNDSLSMSLSVFAIGSEQIGSFYKETSNF